MGKNVSPIRFMTNITIWGFDQERSRSIEAARAGMQAIGVTPIEAPFRGGTDGSKITYKGIPTPNLFVGGETSMASMNLLPWKRWKKPVI